jgi:aerobic-type carbon monoxide dehydrogenase small subunit (CoxS/CutS family)
VFNKTFGREVRESVEFDVNGSRYEADVWDDTPLLWVLRDHLGLTGTKFGCGIGLCGSCTVHLDGVAVRSCIVPASAVQGMRITTIEGLAAGASHPVQAAWIAEQVPQCGYCQSGMIMAAASLLEQSPHPSDAEIYAGISNLCRCGTYPRIRRAVRRAAREIANGNRERRAGPADGADPQP